MGYTKNIWKEHTQEIWTDEDFQLHREDGPACIWTDRQTNVVVRESYFLHDLRHRLDGPAYIERDKNSGLVTREEYHVAGKFIKELPAVKDHLASLGYDILLVSKIP